MVRLFLLEIAVFFCLANSVVVREAFRKGTHATVDAVATVSLAAGAAGLIEGGVESLGAGMTEAGADISVDAGESLIESTPVASEPVPVETPPPPAEPIPASAPPPPPAPPAAPTGPGCPTCGKLRSEYGPGPVTRADGTQTLPAGRHDLSQPLKTWHPSDLDSFQETIALKPIGKGDVAPPLTSRSRGVGGRDYRQRDVMLKKIEEKGGFGYPKGAKPEVHVGHRGKSFWQLRGGESATKALESAAMNLAKSAWEKLAKARAVARGEFSRPTIKKKK
jgi:hypothetical protein